MTMLIESLSNFLIEARAIHVDKKSISKLAKKLILNIKKELKKIDKKDEPLNS